MSGHNRRAPALPGGDHLDEDPTASDMTTFLKNQIEEKDKQINALLERDRETNILIQQLQQMLALAAPKAPEDPYAKTPSHGTDRTGQDRPEPAGEGQGATPPPETGEATDKPSE